MPTLIRRCLYIGLGGTGIGTLLKIKKQFIDTYGELPPMIGLLGVDTDGGQLSNNFEVSQNGQHIVLDANEIVKLSIQNARELYSSYPERFSWIDSRNVGSLERLQGLGAGQVRSNGRFVLLNNYGNVRDKIQSVVNRITNVANATNTNYKLFAEQQPIDVHLIFSVCGGTGCGTYIDMAYIIKECLRNCKLSGYAILPDVFKSMTGVGMERVYPNAFGAIQDLDWLMHLNANASKVDIDMLSAKVSTNKKPFEAFFFLDNSNTNGDTYDHVSHLEDMLALAMVTAAGALSAAGDSVNDNVSQLIYDKLMDVDNKSAWVSTMGVCEIMFRGNNLQEIYTYKAMQILIEKLLNTCQDANKLVNDWIDLPQVRIRENNGQDNVIDFLMSKSPELLLADITNTGNPDPEVDSYLENALPKQNAVADKITSLQLRVEPEFEKLIDENLNKDCGVANTANILTSLQAQVEVFKKEMTNEEKDFRDKILPQNKAELDAAKEALKNCSRFTLRRTREGLKEQLLNAAIACATTQREIGRRNAALSFYAWLTNKISEKQLIVTGLKSNLEAVHKNCTGKIAQLSNSVGGNGNLFQIDLTSIGNKNITVDQNDVNLSDYIKNLKERGDEIQSFEHLSTDQAFDKLKAYAMSLPTAVQYGQKSVNDALSAMPQQELDELISHAVTKSLPLLRLDNRGLGIGKKREPYDYYYVGVEDVDSSVLKKDNRFQNSSGLQNVSFVATGQKDRVIIYRQKGVVPAFQIESLFRYESEYKNCNVGCHWDVNYKRRMDSEGYSLMPHKEQDDTLEVWVRGFIFGKIKNEGGKYYVYSEKLGDPLKAFWYELGEHRDIAFDAFKRKKEDIVPELKSIMVQEEKSAGSAKMEELLVKVKAPDAYLKEYSQCNMTTAELEAYGNDKIANLMREEIRFIGQLGK